MKNTVVCDPVAVGDDGWSEWLHPTAPSFLSQCCDCGLVHEWEFQIVPRTDNAGLNPGEGESVIIFRARRALTQRSPEECEWLDSEVGKEAWPSASVGRNAKRHDPAEGHGPQDEHATREAGDARP